MKRTVLLSAANRQSSILVLVKRTGVRYNKKQILKKLRKLDFDK